MCYVSMDWHDVLKVCFGVNFCYLHACQTLQVLVGGGRCFEVSVVCHLFLWFLEASFMVPVPKWLLLFI